MRQILNLGARDVTSPCPSPAKDLTGFLAWHRARFGDARMEGDGGAGGTGGAPAGGAGAGTGAPAGGAGAGAGTDKTFTQADVDRFNAATRDQATRDAQKAFIAGLGLDPATTKAEDIKAALDDKRAQDDAKKDEATRAKDAADAEKLAAQREKDAAATERHQLAVERALVAAGLPGDDVEDIALLVKADRGADAATIKTAVEDLKTKRPALFGTAGQQLPHGDSGGAGAGAGGGGNGKDAQARGKALAAELGWGKQEKQTA